MTGPRILVTGAGGPAGVAVLAELGRLGIGRVAADCDPGAVGLALTGDGAVIPRADDPAFVEHLVEAGRRHGCSGVISTVGEELVVLAEQREQLAVAGLAIWLPRSEALERCLDKWSFAKAMVEGDVATPSTNLGASLGVPGPWIVKPRFGRGSQHVYRTSDPRDLPALLRLVPEPIVQSELPGREFSADCLVEDDGTVAGVVPRWRTETRGGIATRGTTFLDERVDALVRAVVVATGITTCINVQGFLEADPTQPARVVEVNPRFSGTLPLSLAAGADLVGQHVALLAGGRPDPTRLVPRPGVGIARYFADVITDPEERT